MSTEAAHSLPMCRAEIPHSAAFICSKLKKDVILNEGRSPESKDSEEGRPKTILRSFSINTVHLPFIFEMKRLGLSLAKPASRTRGYSARFSHRRTIPA
jgi:hypothetical protein